MGLLFWGSVVLRPPHPKDIELRQDRLPDLLVRPGVAVLPFLVERPATVVRHLEHWVGGGAEGEDVVGDAGVQVVGEPGLDRLLEDRLLLAGADPRRPGVDLVNLRGGAMAEDPAQKDLRSRA